MYFKRLLFYSFQDALSSELSIINSRVKCNHKIPEFCEIFEEILIIYLKTPDFCFLGPFSNICVVT